MHKKTIRMLAGLSAALVSATLLTTVTHAAAPVLIAIGSIDGFYGDFASATAGLLENGVPGNRFGGIGSGLAYLGDDTFLGLPDRGPNAVTFDACVSDTVTYINRVQTLHLSLVPKGPDDPSPLPFTLTPMLVDTTLLSSRQPLDYGAGGTCASGGTVGDGAPALNARDHTHYFTGRSDGFSLLSGAMSTDPMNARLDPESIRVSNDRNFVYLSDEYGPYVYEFDRHTGRRTRVFTLPAKFAIANQSGVGNDEISGNLSGRVANKGMEGLAITPDGRTLVGAMQSALIQDGGDAAGGIVRIITIDIRSGWTHEFAYQLGDGTVSSPKTTISDIVAINNHEFLVDERDSKGLADDSQAKFKRLYRIDLAGADDVSGLVGQANLAPHVVLSKSPLPVPFLDIVSVLNASGIGSYDIPAKLEGVAFGPDVNVGGVMKHTLWVANDNDFLQVVANSKGTTANNPNTFFVFAFTDTDLPGFVPQHFTRDDDRDREHERQYHDKDGDKDGGRGRDRDGDHKGGGPR